MVWFHLCPQLNIFGLPCQYTSSGAGKWARFWQYCVAGLTSLFSLGFALSFLHFGRHCSSCYTPFFILALHRHSLISAMERDFWRHEAISMLTSIFTSLNFSFFIILTNGNLGAIRKVVTLKWPQIHPWSSNYAFQDTISLSKTQLCH